MMEARRIEEQMAMQRARQQEFAMEQQQVRAEAQFEVSGRHCAHGVAAGHAHRQGVRCVHCRWVWVAA